MTHTRLRRRVDRFRFGGWRRFMLLTTSARVLRLAREQPRGQPARNRGEGEPDERPSAGREGGIGLLHALRPRFEPSKWTHRMTREVGELSLLHVPCVVARRVLEERRRLTIRTVLAHELWAVPLICGWQTEGLWHCELEVDGADAVASFQITAREAEHELRDHGTIRGVAKFARRVFLRRDPNEVLEVARLE